MAKVQVVKMAKMSIIIVLILAILRQIKAQIKVQLTVLAVSFAIFSYIGLCTVVFSCIILSIAKLAFEHL